MSYVNNGLLNKSIIFIRDFRWLSSTGPLWFVEVLLFFCIIYAAAKYFFKPLKIHEIKAQHIIFSIILIAIAAFFVRLVFPIGSSFLNLQFSYFSSYIVLFAAGILIGENDLLDNITNEKNIKWLKLTFIIGIPLWSCIMLFGGALEGINGGFCWQSFAFAIWESFTAIGLSIGIIALFRKK